LSVILVIAALAGPQWLSTEEKFLDLSKYNATSLTKNFIASNSYKTLYTKSSLWTLCTSATDTITKSIPFFIISGVILILSFGLFMLETCAHQHIVSYFISGGLFIISGLLMLSGLIMYISIFKSEVGFKLRPKSYLQPRPLTFQYGQSFYLYVIGLLMLSGLIMYISIFKSEVGFKLRPKSYLQPRPLTFQYGQSFYLYVIGFIFTELIGVANVLMYISVLKIGDN
uniref:Uncharacterized protein n=1 Tax=Lutzomyia longipalpis TaxID=7200 RepID=A0A1B0CFQ4_LUTLO